MAERYPAGDAVALAAAAFSAAAFASALTAAVAARVEELAAQSGFGALAAARDGDELLVHLFAQPDRRQPLSRGVLPRFCLMMYEALEASGAVSVAAGGFVEGPNQRLAVTHTSPVKTAADLGLMAIGAGVSTAPRSALPTVRRLTDVADVVEGFQPPIGDGVINGGPGLLLIVEKQPEGNTLQVTRDVEAALAALKPALTGVDVDSTIFRPATFIEMSLETVATRRRCSTGNSRTNRRKIVSDSTSM